MLWIIYRSPLSDELDDYDDSDCKHEGGRTNGWCDDCGRKL